MSDPERARSRARGRSSGRARGVPTPQGQAQQRLEAIQQQQTPQPPQQSAWQRPPQQQQPKPPPPQQSAWQRPPQQQAPPPAQQPQAPPGLARGTARGRGQVVRPTEHTQPQLASPEEEGAYGIDPNVEQIAGAFRGLSMGEPKPGSTDQRRGAFRGRREIQGPPEKTKPESMTIKQGKDGQPIQVVTNYFRLIKKTNWSLYQYRVDFSPEEERTKVRKAMLRDHKDVLGEAYIFDGSMLFTINRLEKDVFDVFSKRDSDQAKIKITVKFTNDLALGDYQYIQLYNIILRSCIDALDFQLVGRDYFDPRQCINLRNFRLEIWPGFSTSILQHEENIMLGIDVSHKVLRTDTALDFIEGCRKRFRETGPFISEVQAALSGTTVFTYYNNKPYRISNVDFQQNPTSTFKWGDKNVSYVDYYQQKYQIRIKNLNQPLLVSKPKARDIRGGRQQDIVLIPELCHMTGLSDEMRGNFSLMKAVAEHTRIGPSDRIESYYGFSKRMLESKEVQKKLDIWNIKFAEHLEVVNARQLNPEPLTAGEHKIMDKHNGDWTSFLRNTKLLLPVELSSWVVISDKRNMRNIKEFLEELYRRATGLGFKISYPNLVSLESESETEYAKCIEEQIKTGRYQMIMVVIQMSRNDIYAAVKKKCTTHYPMPSQVIATKTLTHKNLPSVATKIAIQMNCKLGGIPWYTPLPFKREDKTDAATMVIGFDVCHETKNKCNSVGAMVASVDYYFSKFYSAVSFQNKNEELSSKIAGLVVNAFYRFREENGYLPPKVIFYRDGVGESNIKYVLANEVQSIIALLKHTFKEELKELQFAFVIVSKRIQARIFVSQARNRIFNPQPGTIVDDVITQPTKYDFFLVSQSVRQGTVTPTNYEVIHDTTKMTANMMQRITYKMTHLYYNCSSTVRVPAQVQYAHKLAFLVGQVTHSNPHVQLANYLHFL